MASVALIGRPPYDDRHDVGVILAAADELAAHPDTDLMLRRAVELARERIGLERVSVWLRDPQGERMNMHGTWGTNLLGQTTDEHGRRHEVAPNACEKLRHIQSSGTLWIYEDNAPTHAEDAGQIVCIHRWFAVTPLVAARNLIGIMYNDAARTHTPLDVTKQTRAAIFCSLLASLLLARRDDLPVARARATAEASPLLQHVFRALRKNVRASGERLARELAISPGHLARSFRAEMGLSLVEYRNRQMLERFFDLVDNGTPNLLAAALEAGFNSYTHFSRVHRKLMGATPSAYLASRRAASPPEHTA